MSIIALLVIFNRSGPTVTTNCFRFAHSTSSLVLVLALALVLVMVLMLVLVLVLELVLALVLMLVLMLVPLLYFQRNVASSVSPLPCVLRNMLENKKCRHRGCHHFVSPLLFFGGDVASSVSPLPVSGLGPVTDC